MFDRAVHPGEILKEELAELGISPTEFSRQISVPPNRVSQIISGKRSITGDTALRIGHWFGNEPEFWMNLQAQFELAVAVAPALGTTLTQPEKLLGVGFDDFSDELLHRLVQRLGLVGHAQVEHVDRGLECCHAPLPLVQRRVAT